MADDERHAEFVVQHSFTMTGRGTCVRGYVTFGVVHTGDELEWFDGTLPHRCTCRGVSPIRTVPISNPPTLALAVPDAKPEDFSSGTVISVHPSHA